jgi:RimJ/RimL family protein N-acetyltransferase
MRLEEISFEDSQKMLSMANEENFFIFSNSEEREPISDYIEGQQLNDEFRIFNFMKGRKRIGLIISFGVDEELNCILGFIYMKPKYRGKGFGDTMLGLFVKKARELKFKGIATECWGSNVIARHLLEKIGFKKQEEIFEDRENNESTVSYLLKL